MNKILGVVLGVGCLFRLLYLGKRQLWTDELMQALVIRASSVSEMIERLRSGMALPTPLDYFVQKGVVLLLGESTWALRLHAVIFGTLSLWFFFRIARLLFGDRVAIYSTILLAVYPLHHHYSQEGRPYALFVFLTLVSYDLLLRRVAGKNHRWTEWILLGCVLLLLLYTSFLGGLVICSQLAGLLFSASSNARRELPRRENNETPEFPRARWSHVAAYALAAALACALFIPWVRFAWAKPEVAEVSEIADVRLILRTIKELGDNSYPMAGVLLLGVGAGVRALLRHRRRQALIWLLTWSAISLPAVIVLEIWSGYFFAIRHVLHVTPSLILIAGYGLSYVGERLTILDRLPYRVSAPAIFYAVIVTVISIWIAQSHWRQEHADWLGTAKFLQENLRPGDVLTVPQVHPLIEYHAPSLAGFRVEDLDPGPGSLRSGEASRRYVVCFNHLSPDPCSGFRARAARDTAWRKQEFRGFMVFIREK